MNPMPIGRDVPTRASTSESFVVEEWHFELPISFVVTLKLKIQFPRAIYVYICNCNAGTKYTSLSHTMTEEARLNQDFAAWQVLGGRLMWRCRVVA